MKEEKKSGRIVKKLTVEEAEFEIKKNNTRFVETVIGEGEGRQFFSCLKKKTQAIEFICGVCPAGVRLSGSEINLLNIENMEMGTIDARYLKAKAIIIQDTNINGLLRLKKAKLGELILKNVNVLGELELEEATVEKITLINTRIGGELNFAFKKAPKLIRVSSEIAESVHRAAPIVPIIIHESTITSIWWEPKTFISRIVR